MPYKKEEDDDLFDDDFEFVDEDDDEEDEYEDEEDGSEPEDSEVEEVKKRRSSPKKAARSEKKPRETAPKSKAKSTPKPRGKAAEKAPPPVDEVPVEDDDESSVIETDSDEIIEEPVGPPADHVVHIYEFRKFKRTIGRDFTSDDADKFAAEFNRTSANLSRWAVSGRKSDQPSPKI